MYQVISGFFSVRMLRPGVPCQLKSKGFGICTISRTPRRISVVRNWVHIIKKRHYYNSSESIFVYKWSRYICTFFQTQCGLRDLRVCRTWYWLAVRRSVESYQSSLIGLLDEKFRNYYVHQRLHPSWNV